MERPLKEYFLPDYLFYLDNISYQRLGEIPFQTQLSLICSDNITVTLEPDAKARILVKRDISFDPNGIFVISISFGAELSFNPETSSGIDWNKINLAEEFKNNEDFVVNNLLSRAALLTAQITSSFGQQPLVLPGSLTKH